MALLPKQAAKSCLRRARRFLELAENDSPVIRCMNDLRRMALVMSVAAVDAYLHGIVLRRLADVRRRVDLPKALAQLEIPFAELAALADTSIVARRTNRRTRPWVQVKAALQKRLLRETFQSYDQVGAAFATAGVAKAWPRVATAIGEDAKVIKNRLNGLVHRRNQIVHEGDMKRASRPRRLRFNDVQHSRVRVDIDWVESLIDAMDTVVTSEP